MNEEKMSSSDKVRRAFPDAEWEWWYVSNPNGTTSYMAIVFTEARTVLGTAMDHSLTMAQHKAYIKAAKHPYVTGWHSRTTGGHR